MFKRLRTFIAGIGVLAAVGNAEAATLTVVTGDVMFSAGGPFVAATGSIAVKPGNSVYAGPGGSASWTTVAAASCR